MPSTNAKPIGEGLTNPMLRSGAGSTGSFGTITAVSGRLGPSLLVDGATYKNSIFVAPVDGCKILKIFCVAAVAIAGGTDTLALNNYDASANTARNVLSTTNIDPTTITVSEGFELTLSTTEANLIMDAGDALIATLVCGTMTTDGEGLSLTALIQLPTL